MARVITFSRVYPPYHPKAGQPTYFIEKIWASLNRPVICNNKLKKESSNDDIIWPKYHTIRAGHRWKVGDWFSPRVWSGKPYNSKMITIAPDIQIKKVWDFEMDILVVCSIAKPGEQQIYKLCYDEDMDERIAKNDGLSPEDWYWWFRRSPDFKKNDGFHGQIICWNESIEY